MLLVPFRTEAGSNYQNKVKLGGGNIYYDGRGGNDVIRVGKYFNLIYGGRGHDELVGGDSYDFFIGGDGNDTLSGGGGREHFSRGIRL